MVTITLEHGSEMEKTHFKNVEELVAYLTGKPVQYPHDNPEFLAELRNRSAEMDEDSSKAISWDDMLQNLKR